MELKEKNLLDILKVIQIHRPITTPDVAVKSNVSSVTAHNFILELKKANIVAECGIAKSNGGRKATLYKTNNEFGYMIGLNHGRTRMTTGIYDLSLNTVRVNRIKTELSSYNATINSMKQEMNAIITESGVPKEKILGIGITLPGQVNHREGVVNSMLNLHEWENTPLQSIMERYFGLPVCVYNDNRANVIACKWRNMINGAANAVYINISDGVSAGVLIGGEVFSGSHSFAGEIGHLAVHGKKNKCQCGGEGCVETVASSIYVIKQVKKKFGAAAMRGNSTKTCENEIVEMAKSNPDVYKIIREAVGYFPYIIDSAIKAYDPEKIIIYNAWLLHFNELYAWLTETVFKNCRWLKKNTFGFELDAQDISDSYGPASVILENLFNFESANRIVLKMDK